MKKFLLFFVAMTFGLTSFAQQVNISGKVLDAATHEPVIGATVLQVGTANGAITDADGSYSFSVPANAEIIAESVGYIAATEAVANRTVINFELKIDAQVIDETVVIGYGASRKSDLSAAIATKDIGDDVKSRPGGIISALQGQIAGVTISNNGGDPVGGGQNVVIRGQGSRSGDPILYVVDGVPGAPYNSQDVVNITVLKDAASAAIYGATAGTGGVILVTTKRASMGKVQISAKASYGIEQRSKSYDMLDAQGYITAMTSAHKLDSRPLPANLDPNGWAWGTTTRTNWLDEIFRLGSTQLYSVSLSGGNETVNAYASAEYNKKKGIMLNTFNESFGGNVALNFKINNWFRINQRLNINYSNSQGDIYKNSHAGVVSSAMFMPPSATVYEVDKQGNILYDAQGNTTFSGTVPAWAANSGVGGGYGEVRNPVASLMRMDQYRPSTSIFSSTQFIFNPIDHLEIRSTISVRGGFGRYQSFDPRIPEIGKPSMENSRHISSTQGFSRLWETVATYERTFGKHNMNVMAGYTMDYNNERQAKTTVYDFPDEDKYSRHFINGTNWSKTKPEEKFWENSSVSVMARGAYSFDDRYFFTASVRRDATSKLFKENNSGIFPAVSGAWKISSEKFMKNQSVISFLKLRASWGQVGNVASVDNYSSAVNLGTNGEFAWLGLNSNVGVKGISMLTIANRNLRWETSEQTDIGFDINFLRNRLTFAADYFIKDTKDLIEDMTIAPTAGISQLPKGNVGKVRNSGFEFSAGWSDKTRSGFEYSVNGNITFIKNEIKDLGGVDFMHHGDNVNQIWTQRSRVGLPWYAFYLIPTDGLFQSQGEIDAYVGKDGQKIQPNARPGDLKFVDTDENGQINDSDRVYYPSYTPKITYGLSANFAWKGFDLYLMLQGVSGNRIFNYSKQMGASFLKGYNMMSEVLDSYQFNKESGIPLLSVADSNNTKGTASDYFLEDGSYARLKNVTLGYTLPQKWFNNSSWKPNIRVYFSGENLATITKYSGLDPECGNSGRDGGVYPLSRVYSFGVTLAF